MSASKKTVLTPGMDLITDLSLAVVLCNNYTHETHKLIRLRQLLHFNSPIKSGSGAERREVRSATDALHLCRLWKSRGLRVVCVSSGSQQDPRPGTGILSLARGLDAVRVPVVLICWAAECLAMDLSPLSVFAVPGADPRDTTHLFRGRRVVSQHTFAIDPEIFQEISGGRDYWEIYEGWRQGSFSIWVWGLGSGNSVPPRSVSPGTGLGGRLANSDT